MELPGRWCFNCKRQPEVAPHCEKCGYCLDCCQESLVRQSCAWLKLSQEEQEGIYWHPESSSFFSRMQKRTGNRHYPLILFSSCCEADFFEEGSEMICCRCRLKARIVERIG